MIRLLDRVLAAVVVFLLCLSAGNAQRQLENGLHLPVLRGIDLTLKGTYSEADSIFANLEGKYPHHPAPTVYRAGVRQSRMIDYRLEMRDVVFDSLLEKGLAKCEAYIEMYPDQPWGYFFRGTARGYASYACVARGDWLGGFVKGISAVSDFEKSLALDSTLFDAWVGIGAYRYWRSEKSEFLHWLPFVDDQRDEAISLILRTVRQGIYNRFTAINVLTHIYLTAGRPEAALELVQEGLRTYPNHRVFLWEKGDALMALQRYAEAVEHFEHLLRVVEQGEEPHRYNKMLCLLRLAQAKRGISQDAEALNLVEKAIAYGSTGIPAYLADRGRERLDEAKRLLVELRLKISSSNGRK